MRIKLFSWLLVAASIVLVLFSVLACGNPSSSAQNSATSAPGSPTQNPAPQGTPIPPTPVPHTPPAQSHIVLSLDKQRYTTRGRILVTITNHLSAPIFVSSYYTNCTVISLELNIQNTWQRQGRCLTAAPHSVAAYCFWKSTV